ncbi:MAG: hypothetical protein CSA62_04920 [Planctomycetota bacterium]|nr:MAG: hypothetical protein CSA62_04920 [Planctomycetota bacterium]
MSRWQRTLSTRFALALAAGLIGLLGPAWMLLAARGRELPLAQLAYVALPLCSLAAATVTVLLLAERREWQILALAGLSPARIALPLCLVAASLWFGFAVLMPGSGQSASSTLERSFYSIPAGPKARAFQGEALLLAAERIEGERLVGAVLFAGEAEPRRLGEARLQVNPEGALLSWSDGQRQISPMQARALRRLRREFFRDPPISWLWRLPDPIAVPHLLLALVTALGPLFLVQLAHARGALHRPRTATVQASLALASIAFLLFAALRLWLSLRSGNAS